MFIYILFKLKSIKEIDRINEDNKIYFITFVIFLLIGFCVIYNTEEMKVIDDFNRDCTNFTEDPCPTRYISTDAYMCRFSIFAQ